MNPQLRDHGPDLSVRSDQALRDHQRTAATPPHRDHEPDPPDPLTPDPVPRRPQPSGPDPVPPKPIPPPIPPTSDHLDRDRGLGRGLDLDRAR